MVGHHSDRYEHFGYAAAQLDDLAGLFAVTTDRCADRRVGAPGRGKLEVGVGDLASRCRSPSKS